MSQLTKGTHEALSKTSPDSSPDSSCMAFPRTLSTLESPCILFSRALSCFWTRLCQRVGCDPTIFARLCSESPLRPAYGRHMDAAVQLAPRTEIMGEPTPLISPMRASRHLNTTPVIRRRNRKWVTVGGCVSSATCTLTHSCTTNSAGVQVMPPLKGSNREHPEGLQNLNTV